MRFLKTGLMVLMFLISLLNIVYAQTLKDKLARDGMFANATRFASKNGKIAEIRRDTNGNDQIWVDNKQVTFIAPIRRIFMCGTWGNRLNNNRQRIYDVKWSPDEKKLAITIDLLYHVVVSGQDRYSPMVFVLFLNNLKMVFVGGAKPGWAMYSCAYCPKWIDNNWLKYKGWADGMPFDSAVRCDGTVDVNQCEPIIDLPAFEKQNKLAGVKMQYPTPPTL
ncbi:hypothetical protein A3F08_02460 [Candidatus Berkelbacteria bacterium RIFCSPHIGHO2_12_FULL_36_9]|uniref:Uncharacterized protein n=1 Tax=Candidatus Berkelbacteria bacterium RIFCSPHIGHO2_12_FULL_36_9 TaxID=1797469 RepID=A0A1F5EIL6_9BACT|nr:MAG: hypothetical protein A3F08_02460 [Candidatus Berkelbacteria bacterium RIFCSPHIGHO2_12_FULL_36_9]